ncbi:MAG: hypothetical protein HZA46_02485 [Planctomycetales bacterium]|nr:hypothetical protein [Planctomycetales bacterium]
MDKLKAALVYKFWMLLAVALIVPLVGWWMATSAISAQVGDRITKVNSAFTGLTASGENPNDKWTSQIKRQMGVQETAVQQAHQFLFEAQKSLLTWPVGLSWQSGTIPTESQITQKDIDYYRNLYDNLILEVHQIPSPIDPTTGTGLVNFPFDRLPHEDYTSFPPSRLQIIETREDMWLFSTLLTAIARVNEREEAKTQLEAPVRQILKIELRGGKSRGPSGLGGGTAVGQGGMPATGAGPGGAGALGMMPSMGAMGGGAGGGHGDGGRGSMMGGAGGGGGGPTNVEFDPTEDFGSDSDGGVGGGGQMGSMPPGGGGVAAGPASGHGGGGGGGARGKNRYLEENSKYKIRGFYMSLTMDHRKLPDLLVELSNSPWPIRVMRVQQADMHMQDLAAADGIGGAGAGAGYSGIPGGFAAGGGFGAPNVRTGGAGPMPGEGGGVAAGGSMSALDDPFLVQVAFCGFFTIYKPPATPPSTGATPDGGSPGTPAPSSPDASASRPLVGTPGEPEAVPATAVTPSASGVEDKASSTPDPAKPGAAPADESKKDSASPPAEATEGTPSKPKPADEKPLEKAVEKAEKSTDER